MTFYTFGQLLFGQFITLPVNFSVAISKIFLPEHVDIAHVWARVLLIQISGFIWYEFHFIFWHHSHIRTHFCWHKKRLTLFISRFLSLSVCVWTSFACRLLRIRAVKQSWKSNACLFALHQIPACSQLWLISAKSSNYP